MKRSTPILFILASTMSAGASAGIITFTDRAAFIAATGATAVGPLPGGASSAGFSVGDLTFSQEPLASLNTSRNWSTLISEDFDLAINGVEDYNVDSAVPLFSFGFDFHEPTTTTPPGPVAPDTCNTAVCDDSVFEVTLLDGAIVVDAFPFTRPKDMLEFVGVWSTDSFDRIEIRETAGTNDNEFFGNFLTGTTPIPEPAAVALLGLGLVGLGFGRREQRR